MNRRPLGRNRFTLFPPVLLLLLALCAILYLPGLWTVPVTDRDEARFAQATRQMIETGDWITIHFQSEARHKKPILTHWAQGVIVRATGGTPDSGITHYRLASTLAATTAVILLVLLWGKPTERTTNALAGALLASSILLIVEARLATSDALLLTTVVAAQCALWRVYSLPPDNQRNWPWVTLFWTALGFGILTKGPILPALSLLTLITLCIADRSCKLLVRLRPWLGIPLTLLIVIPWLWAVQKATGGTFLQQALLEDFWSKLVSSQESHGLPPGFYLITIPALLWPGSLFTGLALGRAWNQRKTGQCERFLLAWIIPFWLILELVPTKLPHYALPLYPALCLLTARFIMDATAAARTKSLAPRLGFILWIIIGTALAIAPIAGLWYLGNHTIANLPGTTSIIAAGIIITLAVLAVRLGSWEGRLQTAALCSIAAAIPLSLSVFAFTLPNMHQLWLSRAIAEFADQYRDTTASVAVFTYHEPSVVFELGTATRFASPNTERDPLADLPAPILCFLPDGEAGTDILKSLANNYQITQQPSTTIEGFNYSKGQPVRLRPVILDRQPPGEEPTP